MHLVSSFLSPLSPALSLPLSLAIPCFFSAEGGMGKGRWTGPGGEGRGGGSGGGGSHHGYNATTNIHQVVKIKTNGSAL